MHAAVSSNRPHRQYSLTVLWTLMGLALVYAVWLLSKGTITGHNTWDAVLGVLLGLYICSRPVGNALDLLFTQDSGRWPGLFRRVGLTWMALNLVVLITGWFIVFLGATRLPRPNF